MTDEPPAECLDWRGKRWTPEIGAETGANGGAPERALHGARVASARSSTPDWERPGACRSARSSSAAAAPRRCRSCTRRSTGRRRVHRRDDGLGDDGGGGGQRRARCGATRWRCCRSAATTWATTSGTGSGCSAALSETPKIFHVNWFRKDADGRFLWPGSARTCACCKWIVDRVRGRVPARETPIGWMPRYEDIDWRGLPFPRRQFDELQAVDPRAVAARGDRARGAVHRAARPPAAGDGLRARAVDLPAIGPRRYAPR